MKDVLKQRHKSVELYYFSLLQRKWFPKIGWELYGMIYGV